MYTYGSTDFSVDVDYIYWYNGSVVRLCHIIISINLFIYVDRIVVYMKISMNIPIRWIHLSKLLHLPVS